ncbi:MAG: hypothetical protein AAF583_12360 [Pseudomonadota bacterium]
MQGHQGAETDDVIMSDADKKVVLKTGKFFDASGYVPEVGARNSRISPGSC